MRVLVATNTEQGVGIHNALLALGHESFLWQESHKPAFDAFEEIKPRLVVADRKLVTRAIQKCVERSGTRLITPDNLEPLADTVIYHPGKYDAKLASRFVVIGQQDESVVRKFCEPVGRFGIRCYGSYRYREMVQYVGQHNIETFNNLCVSCCYVLNFGDSAQLTWNALAAGARVIQSDKIPWSDGFPEVIVAEDLETVERLGAACSLIGHPTDFALVDEKFSYKSYVRSMLDAKD